jgi:hypothetical protein
MVLLLTLYGLQLFAESLRELFQIEHSRPPVRHNKSQAVLASSDHITSDYFPFVALVSRGVAVSRFPSPKSSASAILTADNFSPVYLWAFRK